MPEQFGATLFLPEEALRIREVREAMEEDFSELNVGGAVDGVVTVWGLLDWGEMPELEPVLEHLGIGFDLCVEAKDEYDGFSVYFRPDPRTGKAVRRELLATQAGKPAVTLEELLAFVRERGGTVRAEELEAAFGAPESLREWAGVHRAHLERLVEADPAPEE